MNFDDLKYLAVPLPEDIMKEKWAGYFDRARRIIDCRLADDTLPKALRARLEIELHHLDNLEVCYRITPEEGLRQVQKRIPDMTAEKLEQLRIEGKIDWIYVNGEVRYLRSFASTLFDSYPELLCEAECRAAKESINDVDEIIHDCVHGGLTEMAAHIHIRHDAHLDPEAVEEGKELHVYLPLPVERDGIKNLHILEVYPKPEKMPALEEAQPTVYFAVKAEPGQAFSVEYEYERYVPYRNPETFDLAAVDATADQMPEDVKPYLEEEYPHIRFTPYLRELAAEIKGEETNLLLIARRIYDWVTVKTDYRYMRDYISLDNIAEYCGVNRRGDCGVQSVLLITLMRICGIPARWESGLGVRPGRVGQHDWAMFFIPSIGWLYCDPAYGGDARILGKTERWNFFFCNVGPYWLPLNRGFQKDFVPPVKFMRFDPYDNQVGEAEYLNHKVPRSQFDITYTDKGIRRIK